jgi:TPR repeat protein
MKFLSVLMLGLLMVFVFTGLQNVSADQGDEDFKTGIKYYNGDGVNKDYVEALKWFRKAADQGNSFAQYNIGAMYHEGQGVTKDRVAAIKWLRKAADQGHQKAKDALQRVQEATPLSLQDTGSAWKEASMSARTEFCKTLARDYGSNGLTNDYKYWLYHIDDWYRTSETLGLSIEVVVNTLNMQISINERQKYLGR